MDWKTRQIAEILGLPKLDTKYLPIHILIALKDQLAKITGIGAVILFGSIVRGEASPKSDIDIMVIPAQLDQIKTLKERVGKILNYIEVEYKLAASFSLIIYTGQEDPYFLWETVKDGAVIYITPELVTQAPQSIKPYAVISYSYLGLSENEKKRVSRFIFESKSGLQLDRSNRMEYIAPGVLLLTLERSKMVTDFFDDLNVKYSMIKVWI